MKVQKMGMTLRMSAEMLNPDLMPRGEYRRLWYAPWVKRWVRTESEGARLIRVNEWIASGSPVSEKSIFAIRLEKEFERKSNVEA